MNFFRQKAQASPIYARVAPYVIFILLTVAQEMFGEAARYWIYLGKTIVGAWLVWEMRSFVSEMRWEISTEAVAVGIGVCIMWVGIDSFYSHMGSDQAPWNPRAQFGGHSTLASVFIAGRVLGSTFVVPPIEEVFFRSFLYRYFVRTDFQQMPFNRFHPTSFIVTSALFGCEHSQWLAGILCGCAYQWLVISKNRLGDAIAAHAITNFLLGFWVVSQGAWKFW